tara:strand:- start:974 stop:1372 length:399 start_codon:yes stop_codon:yes gene_type:complete
LQLDPKNFYCPSVVRITFICYNDIIIGQYNIELLFLQGVRKKSFKLFSEGANKMDKWWKEEDRNKFTNVHTQVVDGVVVTTYGRANQNMTHLASQKSIPRDDNEMSSKQASAMKIIQLQNEARQRLRKKNGK